MELLELKSVWNAVIEESMVKDSIDAFVVEKSLKKDSKSVLGKIKSVMYFKFIFGLLSVLGSTSMLIGSFINPDKFTFLETILSIGNNRALWATIIVFMIAMLSWNFNAFLEIKQFERNTNNIKTSLNKIINIMTETIKLNVYFGIAFNCLSFGWIAYLVNNTNQYVEGTFPILFFMAGVVTVSAIVFYFISRYEQKLKFGNYVNQLKSYLDDLNEQ